ncbi:hypothetical protein JCM19240_1326 [Vibrio maritimus]|uniref:DUF2835 domain-containing protein n=1 Tax=Vibrio maritimus TaxID=990268 RepID=A0A090T5C7_9VIBR|nr:hypothetical protein JCM19240_1326 [Vibrio maritimus]
MFNPHLYVYTGVGVFFILVKSIVFYSQTYRRVMKHYYFSLNISYQQYFTHYTGHASSILVYTDQGLRLQLPATRFRPFLTQLGLKGRFRLTTDQNNKFLRLESL